MKGTGLAARIPHAVPVVNVCFLPTDTLSLFILRSREALKILRWVLSSWLSRCTSSFDTSNCRPRDPGRKRARIRTARRRSDASSAGRCGAVLGGHPPGAADLELRSAAADGDARAVGVHDPYTLRKVLDLSAIVIASCSRSRSIFRTASSCAHRRARTSGGSSPESGRLVSFLVGLVLAALGRLGRKDRPKIKRGAEIPGTRLELVRPKAGGF